LGLQWCVIHRGLIAARYDCNTMRLFSRPWEEGAGKKIAKSNHFFGVLAAVGLLMLLMWRSRRSLRDRWPPRVRDNAR
jgi:hypothetical protein